MEAKDMPACAGPAIVGAIAPESPRTSRVRGGPLTLHVPNPYMSCGWDDLEPPQQCGVGRLGTNPPFSVPIFSGQADLMAELAIASVTTWLLHVSCTGSAQKDAQHLLMHGEVEFTVTLRKEGRGPSRSELR
jgi:hypothetical protein